MPYKDKKQRLEYHREYNKMRYQLNRDVLLAKHNQYNHIHKDEKNKKQRESYHKAPEKKRFYKIKQKYNLDIKEYNELLQKQKLLCAICKQPLDLQHTYYVHVDHDHKRGKVRGILCRNCNLGLGQFKENIEYLKNAIIYLKENEIL